MIRGGPPNERPKPKPRMGESTMKDFIYNHGNKVRIKASDEVGNIIGRADYPDAPNDYYVLYKASDGRAVKNWWRESELCTC